MLFNFVTWDISPEIFSLGPLSIRYYGLFFAISFLLGYYILEKIFKEEKAPLEWLDKLFVYVVIATIVGARLGHVFFYGWDYYSQNLGEIIKVWRGGLASHGGGIGILVAIWYFSKKVTKKSPLWTLDKMAVSVALAGFFIRMGNLMNSEIVGQVTEVAWGFKFLRADVLSPELPRHPAQVYEALSYLFVCGVLAFFYWKTSLKNKQGFLFGVFLIGIFTARFVIEFVKENQEAFEEGMVLNMGQFLSVPFVLVGLFFVVRALLITKND